MKKAKTPKSEIEPADKEKVSTEITSKPETNSSTYNSNTFQVEVEVHHQPEALKKKQEPKIISKSINKEPELVSLSPKKSLKSPIHTKEKLPVKSPNRSPTKVKVITEGELITKITTGTEMC